MRRAIWIGVRDAALYAFLLQIAWRHAHWSVFALLLILCLRAVLQEIVMIKEREEDNEDVKKIDAMLERMKAK